MLRSTEQERDKAFLVVTGVSALEIEALGHLASQLPPDFPAPIVVAQHLAPSQASRLDEHLVKHTVLPVRSIAGAIDLEPGAMYIVPSNYDIEIVDDAGVMRAQVRPGQQPTLDSLFVTAAQAYGDRLIAIILSGLGSDGQSGARAVREAGGTIVVQAPSSAESPSMPLAIPPTLVDIVARPEDIGNILLELVRETKLFEEAGDQKPLRTLLSQLRERCGIDFTQYKSPTITRRLARLMAAGGFSTISEYSHYLQRHPEGYQRLANSFLVKVTEFFRDAPLYDQLRDYILPKLISEAEDRAGELRIWSAGSSTGEEAYSIAIACAEFLREEAHINVRIFATDVDEDAIAFARRGVYSREALRHVPEAWIQRHFIRNGDTFEVSKRIRNMTVFGQHDLAQRAPFPRVDLCMCRNVLIYFTKELQMRALQLFAFALRDRGYLVLGKAESTTPAPQFFRLVNPALKIYQREGERVLLPPTRLKESSLASNVDRACLGSVERMGENRKTSVPSDNPRSSANEILGLFISASVVGVVIVDRRYDIIAINSAARSMLQIHGVGIGEDLIHLASVAGNALRSLIDQAFRGQSVEPTVLMVKDPVAGIDRWLQLFCYPEPMPRAGRGESVALVLIDVTQSEAKIRQAERKNVVQEKLLAEQKSRGEELSQRLKALLAANDELTAINAELRTYNEQLLIGAEEAASANEEIETLNEEMQATNEELETLNEELQATVEELNTTNDELEARGAALEQVNAARELEVQAARAEIRALRIAIEAFEPLLVIVDSSGILLYASSKLAKVEELRTSDGQWWRKSMTLRLCDGKRYRTAPRSLEGNEGIMLVSFQPLELE